MSELGLMHLFYLMTMIGIMRRFINIFLKYY